jgi:hypothetical protein
MNAHIIIRFKWRWLFIIHVGIELLLTLLNSFLFVAKKNTEALPDIKYCTEIFDQPVD